MNGYNVKKRLTRNESDRIWQMKAWGVLFVTCAHCAGVLDNAPAASRFASQLLNSLGTLGVPIFFFLAGYVFRYKKLMPWLKEKVTGILIPWITTGVLVYLYVYLRKGGVSVCSLALWLIGDDGYLWFLSVMVMLWFWARLIFWGIEKGNFWTLPVAASVSVCLSVTVLLLEHLDVLSFHHYLNLFRWLWIFALGLLAGSRSFLNKTESRFWLVPVWMLVLLGLIVLRGSLNYWSVRFYLFAYFTIAVFANCFLCSGMLANYLQTLGKDSFAVYLLHMPVAGIVANLCNRVSDFSGILTVLRPFVVLGVTHAGIILMKKTARKLRVEKAVQLLFSFR